jgi:hypothetical protein
LHRIIIEEVEMIKIIFSLLVILLILADIPKSFAESDNPKSHCGIFILDNCSDDSGFTNKKFGGITAEYMKTSIQESIALYATKTAFFDVGKIKADQMARVYVESKTSKISEVNCKDLGNLKPEVFSRKVIGFLNENLKLNNAITHFLIPLTNSISGVTTLILFDKSGKFVTMGRTRGNYEGAGMELAGNINKCENFVITPKGDQKIDLANSVMGDKIVNNISGSDTNSAMTTNSKSSVGFGLKK